MAFPLANDAFVCLFALLVAFRLSVVLRLEVSKSSLDVRAADSGGVVRATVSMDLRAPIDVAGA